MSCNGSSDFTCAILCWFCVWSVLQLWEKLIRMMLAYHVNEMSTPVHFPHLTVLRVIVLSRVVARNQPCKMDISALLLRDKNRGSRSHERNSIDCLDCSISLLMLLRMPVHLPFSTHTHKPAKINEWGCANHFVNQ